MKISIILFLPILILVTVGCENTEKHNSSESSAENTDELDRKYFEKNADLYRVLADNIPYPTCSNFDLYLFPLKERERLSERFINYLNNLDTIYLTTDLSFYSTQLDIEAAYFKKIPGDPDNCIVKASPIVFTRDSNYFAVYIQKINLQDSIENETYIFYNDNGKWKHVAFSIEPMWN